MQLTESILEKIEGMDEEEKSQQIKNQLNINYERNARVILNALGSDTEKYREKLIHEVNKLEKKVSKEYKKMQKKMESYNNQFSISNDEKILELQAEITELKGFL